jgi:tetratricopeptide (TPR) repeat protein
MYNQRRVQDLTIRATRLVLKPMSKISTLASLLLFVMAVGPSVQTVSSRGRPRLHGSARAQPAGTATHDDGSAAWLASYNAEVAGKLQEALNALSQLPPGRRDGYLANFRRGWLQYRLGRYAESISAYRSASSLEPASIEARVAMLLPQLALTKWNDLEQTAEEVLARDPENYLALQRLAFAKFSTQHFGEAERLYRRLLVLYPSDVEMRSCLGWTVLRMGKQKEALSLFSEVLELNPTHALAKQGLQEARGGKKTAY